MNPRHLVPPAHDIVRRRTHRLVTAGAVASIGGFIAGVGLGILGLWAISGALALTGLIAWMIIGSHVERTLHQLELATLSWENHVCAYLVETEDLPMPLVRQLFRKSARYGDADFPDAYATWTATGETGVGRRSVTITVSRLGSVAAHLTTLREA